MINQRNTFAISSYIKFYSFTHMDKRLLLMPVCLLWFGVLAGRAADRYVVTNGADSGDCLTWATAASNIQFAVNLASNANDTVWVSNGAYIVTNQITITNNITVKGLNGYSNTLVYADWPSYTTRCFYVANTGVLDGFTISNGHWWGNAALGGGGAFIGLSSTVQNCYFTYNACSNTDYVGGGGGVYVATGTVKNCYFVTNVAFNCYGGGGALFQDTLVTNSFFIMNRGANTYGGGIYLQSRTRLRNCFIISNTASTQGGGVVADNLGGSMSNCTIAFNRASDYGGGVNIGGGVDMADCVISNNYAWNGGGIYAYNGQTFRNCQILNNQSSGGGGGITASYAVLTNCTIAGNRGSGGGGVYDLAYGNNTYDSCQIINNLSTAGAGGGGMLLAGNDSCLRQCLIVNNTNRNGYGGGAYISGSRICFESCTIAGNYSTNDGGGFYLAGTNKYVVNTIIHGNSSFSNNNPDIYNIIAENPGSFSNNCSSAALPAGQGNMTNDPVFVGGGNYRLSVNSPCINAGTNQNWMTNSIDLDGNRRIFYNTVDMGAYEVFFKGTIYKFY